MGKKVEKALSKDKNQSSASHDTAEHDLNENGIGSEQWRIYGLAKKEMEEVLEPYKCTGNMQVDFTELCRRVNLAVIPPVIPRPRPPGTPVPHESKPEKGGSKGKQPAPEPEPEPEVNEDGEPIELPPKTYTTKEKYEYFKPCIQVEMDHPDKGDSVTEVFIRGWKIDMSMMGILQMCWPAMDKLHTINLWEVGLTGETLQLLASFLPLCVNLKNVILDGNRVKEENFSSLIGEASTIQSLSLRYCDITKKGALGIGMALGTSKASNTKLLSLNLSGNHIDDDGAEHIAAGLKLNRTLLSLSVSANRIGDKGATKIAEALSRFPLSHEEVVERRRLLSNVRGSPDRNGKSPPPSRREGSKDRPGSVRSSSTHADSKKATRDKPSAKKKDPKAKDSKEDTKGAKKDKEETRGTTRGKGSSLAADSGKTIGGKSKNLKGTKKQANQDAEVDVAEIINPLLEVADSIDGQLWVPGNRILISLNLARNQIAESGMNALLKAIQYQTTLTMDSSSSGSGLMRLCLDKNAVHRDSVTLKKITERMQPKDPFYKQPSSLEGEAA